MPYTDSPFRDDINEAILLLKEDRTVQHIREKWWTTKNIRYGDDGEPVNCTKEEEEGGDDTPDLDVEHILGIVLVLFLGFAFAMVIGVLEFLWNVRKVSISQKVSAIEKVGK